MWCLSRGLSDPNQAVHDHRLIDKLFEQYIQFLSNTNSRVAEASNTILAAQHRDQNLKGWMEPAWGDVRPWKKELTFKMRVPMPKLVVDVLMRWALHPGMFVAPYRAVD